jgi:hypothetical protein
MEFSMKTAMLQKMSCLLAAGAVALICLPAHATLGPQLTTDGTPYVYAPMEQVFPTIPPPPLSDWLSVNIPGLGPWRLDIPEGSPLEGVLVIPTINGAPLPANPNAIVGTALYDNFLPNGAPGQLSDVFGVIATVPGAGPTFVIMSDTDTSPLTLPPDFSPVPIPMPETGAPVPLVGPTGPYIQGQGAFWSDLDAVPDGAATSLLLGLGCTALAALRRKLA